LLRRPTIALLDLGLDRLDRLLSLLPGLTLPLLPRLTAGFTDELLRVLTELLAAIEQGLRSIHVHPDVALDVPDSDDLGPDDPDRAEDEIEMA
jgi:hypothetical protein